VVTGNTRPLTHAVQLGQGGVLHPTWNIGTFRRKRNPRPP